MHRIALCWTTLILGFLTLLSGCRTAPWKTADSESRATSKIGPDFHYASTQESRPEPEPEPEKTTELSLAYARWMEGVGNLIEARRHYRDVIDEHPKHVDALLGLARLDHLAGRTYEAEQGFLAALRLEPESPVVLHALGEFYESEERWPEAVEMLNKAMLAAPTENQYRHELAVALVHTGDIDAARAQFVRTVGDASAHYNIGLILHEMGRVDDAEQQMLLAVTKQPNMEQAQYWLDEIRREREAAWAMQESLAQSAATSESSLQQASYEGRATTPPTSIGSSHSLNANPGTPVRALTPQQQQQLQNQR